jgi:hypothetical protein
MHWLVRNRSRGEGKALAMQSQITLLNCRDQVQELGPWRGSGRSPAVHRGVCTLPVPPVALVIVLVPLPFVCTVPIPPVGEMAVCTPLAPAGFTTVPLGVWYVLLFDWVGEVCNDVEADCAMATHVVSRSPATPVINSFFIIMVSND